MELVTTNRSSEPQSDRARGDMPRILIVDHNVEAANAVASLVETSGHGDTRIAYSGEAARYLIAPPDAAELAELFARH